MISTAITPRRAAVSLPALREISARFRGFAVENEGLTHAAVISAALFVTIATLKILVG